MILNITLQLLGQGMKSISAPFPMWITLFHVCRCFLQVEQDVVQRWHWFESFTLLVYHSSFILEVHFNHTFITLSDDTAQVLLLCRYPPIPNQRLCVITWWKLAIVNVKNYLVINSTRMPLIHQHLLLPHQRFGRQAAVFKALRLYFGEKEKENKKKKTWSLKEKSCTSFKNVLLWCRGEFAADLNKCLSLSNRRNWDVCLL